MATNETLAAPPAPMSAEDEISLLDLLQVVVENLRLLVLGPLLIGLLVFGGTYAIAPTFTATIRFIPPNQQGGGAANLLAGLGALGGLSGGVIPNIKNPADLYVTFLKSRSVTDALIDRFDLMERYQQKYKDDTRKELDGLMRASSGKDGLITLEVDEKDPAFAAELANATVTELGELLKRLAVTEAQQRRVFFDKQLVSAKNKLTQAEQALKSSSVGSATLKSDPRVAIEGLSRLKASITAQETRLGAMRGYLTESAPEFKQAQTELSVLRSQLAHAQEQQPSDASGSSDYVSKYRDFKYQEALFELYAKQYEIARVDESREGAVIQVVDPALPPERKSKPKKAMIAMVATLASGFVLLLFVFMRYALRAAQQNPETSQKLLNVRQAWHRALGTKVATRKP
ncbi:MAG: Wzz/FepE/Etk N-terminal domain-containing protein [Rhodoferax sp.]|nr:Wzz/FepE/Etk N-terminal domain-containing protein [Rhodoferax sp.]